MSYQISVAKALVAYAVTVPGYKNPVTFDHELTRNYGDWLCNICLSRFATRGVVLHTTDCTFKGKQLGFFLSENEHLIYVTGDKDSGIFSPFVEEDIRDIIAVAKKAHETS